MYACVGRRALLKLTENNWLKLNVDGRWSSSCIHRSFVRSFDPSAKNQLFLAFRIATTEERSESAVHAINSRSAKLVCACIYVLLKRRVELAGGCVVASKRLHYMCVRTTTRRRVCMYVCMHA